MPNPAQNPPGVAGSIVTGMSLVPCRSTVPPVMLIAVVIAAIVMCVPGMMVSVTPAGITTVAVTLMLPDHAASAEMVPDTLVTPGGASTSPGGGRSFPQATKNTQAAT